MRRKREEGCTITRRCFSWLSDKSIMLIGFMPLHKQAVVLTSADSCEDMNF